MDLLFALVAAVIGALVIDAIAVPRQRVLRSGAGIGLLVLITLAAFGAFLALSGNPVLAAILSLALQLLLVVASNAKRRMLGESLHFSDLALIGAIFRHPQFYFTALAAWQKAAGLLALVALLAALVWLFDPTLSPHLVGAAIALGALSLIAVALHLPGFRRLAQRPRAEADVTALGLVPTLLLYWLRWRKSENPPALTRQQASGGGHRDEQPQLIIAVQCESFADPAELFGEQGLVLPELERAQRNAVQWGNLLVSGFGAYTMRTEYGVLFGREEEELGFRLFDPFLTALTETSYALPNRLGTRDWRSLFVHPHDMRFYSRHQILPAAGFAELVNEAAFGPQAERRGRYVSDAAVAEKILELSAAADAATFIYSVTMENHGPWSSDGESGADALRLNYDRLVRAGDAMLGQLREGIGALGRPALLAFFGDHRPSIPGASEPGGDRHTPYVLLQFDAQGQLVRGDNRRKDITPATLHHTILGLGGDRTG